MKKTLASALLLLVTTSALAHGGHGMPGAHWHATDTFGLLLVGGLAAVAIWFSGRK